MIRPTVSVLMANFNHGKYLPRALEAIATQSWAPDEFLILDDGSTDNSVEVMESFAARFSFIRILRHPRNLGCLAAIKTLVDASTCDYVYSAAADDFALSGFIEKSMEMVARHPTAGLCSSDPAWLDEVTGNTTVTRLGWSDEVCFLTPDSFASKLRGGFIPGHTSIVRKAALVEAGGYLPQLRWHCDWFAHLVIAFRHGICYVPEALATMTVSETSYSSAGRRRRLEQEEVVSHALALLCDPAYRDVQPFFARAQALAPFQSKVTKAFLTKPRHWNLRTLRLAWPLVLRTFVDMPLQIAARVKRFALRVVPAAGKRMYLALRLRCGTERS